MKKFNYVNLFLSLSVIMFFASCGDKYYTDDFLRNSDEKLCGYTWMEKITYVNENDELELMVHTLFFNKGSKGSGTGKEGKERYRAISGGRWESIPYKTETFAFNWKWIENYEGLSLDDGKEITLFENVWVREFYLSGKYQDEICTFYRD